MPSSVPYNCEVTSSSAISSTNGVTTTGNGTVTTTNADGTTTTTTGSGTTTTTTN